MIMNKNMLSLGIVALVVFALTTNCAKQEEQFAQNDEPTPTDEVKEIPGDFELFAVSDKETKTVNDGMHTKWAGNDAINIFHAEASTSDYVNDGEFDTTDSDKDAGRFTGSLGTALDSGKDYDWYAIYPYKSGITTPANTTTYLYIGGPTNVIPEQDGNNSKSHIAGYNYPMYGKASAVAYNETPSITLEHLASVLEVQVTNNSTSPITVEDVVFTAPSGKTIFGQFIINFAASPITYADGTYTSETSTLKVVSADPIAAGETASFFLAVKPFVAEAGETIKLSVNGYEKAVNLAKNFTFEAGKFKRLTFNYDKEPDIYQLVTNIEAFSDGGKYVFALQDGVSTSTYYFLNNAGSSDNLDTGLTVAANTITNPNKKYIFTAEATSDLFKFINSNEKYLFNSGSSTTVNTNNDSQASWAVSAVDGGYFKFNVSSTTGRYLAANATTPAKVAGYANSNWTSNKGNQHAATANAIAQYSGAWSVFKLGGYTPPAGINNATVNDVPARGASGLTQVVTLINYDAAPSLTATPDGTIITAASVTSVSTTSATITYTIADNYTGAVRAGTITVEDSDSNEGTITVNQVADVFTVSRTSIELNANSGATATFTVNSDFDWTIDDSGLSGFSVSPNSFTYTSTRSQTVTITATGNNSTDSPVDLDIFCVTRTADSKDSDDITVTQRSGKLAAPVLTITPDAANNKFTVSWSAVSNATKYEYYVLDKDLNDKIAATQTADASTLSFEVTSINLGENYYVGVKAIGNSNPWIDSAYAEETVNVAAGDKAAKFEMTDYFDTNTNLVDGQTYSFGAFEFTFEKHNSSTSNYNSSDKGIRFYQNDKWIINAGTKKMKSIAFTTYGSKPGPFTASDTGTCSAAGTTTTWTAKSSGGTSTVTLTADAQIRFKDFTITYVD